MYTLWFVDGGKSAAYPLREGETLIGRAPACDLVINAPTLSRRHARVRVADGRVFLRDAGSTHGCTLNGTPVVGERQIAAGDTFYLGGLQVRLVQDLEEGEVLSDAHHVIDEPGTLLRRVDQRQASPGSAVSEPSSTPHAGVPRGSLTATATTHATVPTPAEVDRRSRVDDRRQTDTVRVGDNRRSGRDRRHGRFLNLLTEISKTLVTVQPLEQVLARVVDLLFDTVPAERAFLLLRDSMDQPLTARVWRRRDGSVPEKVSLSRTIINRVMRERVAMLATDALYDPRLDASGSIQAMSIRSFMCAPLWNQNDVIGVLYCDNPRSKKFTAEDLEVFVALCNYAAVAIEQARVSQLLFAETKRRERLQRYHSPSVINRILHAEGGAEGRFVTQERDITVMFCDIVGFTTLCERMSPTSIGDLLNDFFARMGEVIFEYEGTLDKFIGDAILAVFGAPLDQPDHATRAVAAALGMRAELARANAEHPERTLRMRIAINSGRALTGDIGSPKRREFTVLGDVVNTAARLEASVAEPGQIVISEATRAQIGPAFELRSLGVVTLRGRESGLEAFEVIGPPL
ncbi:MAG: adenylate/guanylate cyclase domain-containing protein [Acidobacteriota bacterium]